MTGRVFSATGKAILAGGYLVLFPEYGALVVALSARMHAVTSVSDAEGNGVLSITVNSPQFFNGSWSYKVVLDDFVKQGLNYKLKEVDDKRNPFVESTILTIIGYALGSQHLSTTTTTSKNITVTMFSDAEYHSLKGSDARCSKNNAYKFFYHKEEITKVPKTGLGSSAGLVTSLTAALLSCVVEDFDIKVSVQNWKKKIHNLAQVAHCKAQGKIGSGFDVASATFGSIIYQRFEPSLITDLLEAKEDTLKKLVYLVDQEDWKVVHNMCTLPPGIRILMGDVSGGSETPKMVSMLLKWRQKEPETCGEVWYNLNQSNMSLVQGLQELYDLSLAKPHIYNKVLQDFISTKPNGIFSNTDTAVEPVKKVVSAIKHIRENLQILTREAGVSIEPESQTKLLDAVSKINGVFGGVVPGAGGYDAICVLVASSQARQIVDITSKDPVFANVRWMDLTEQKNGLIEERIADFEGLL